MDRKCPHTSTILIRRYRKWSILMLVGVACILGAIGATMTSLDRGHFQSSRPQKFRALDLDDDDDDDLFQSPTGRNDTRCVKKVHLFASDREMRHIPELHSYNELFKSSQHPLGASDIDCHSEGYDCDIILTMGGDVEYIKGMDVVVFGIVPTEFRGEGAEQLSKLLKLTPAPGQTWVYFSTETPLRVLRWNRDLNFSRLKYHLLMTYDLASDIVVPFGIYRPYTTHDGNGSTDGVVKSHRLPDPLMGKERMIAWMASNCHAFWPRVRFIGKMRNVLPLDDYGKCGTKECLPKRSEKCNELMAQYKFFFAIPNAECNDYITEKFWLESLTHGNVPVVLGSRKESYEKVAPPNSYIHYSDFKSTDDFVQYLKGLNEDDEAYRRLFDWRSQGEVVLTYPTRPTIFCKTLPHLPEKGKERQYKYIGDSPWYKGCRVTPDRKVFDLTKKEEYSIFEKSDINNWSVWR